nr:transporter [uncultured Desulfuromonas sp.]
MGRTVAFQKCLCVAVMLVAGLLSLMPQNAQADEFDQYIMPLSNPVFNAEARNKTIIRPIYLYQNLPEKVQTIVGKVPLDGHVQGIALAATIALSERFSIVAVKDGYLDCEPDETLSSHSGWADLAAGLQYSLIYDPENQFILSARGVYELPSGDDEIYQGNGDGTITPSLIFLKGFDRLQFSGTLGVVLPIDSSEENTLMFDSWHLSYAVTDWFFPLVEFNHFYVLDSGDRDVPESGLGAIGTGEEGDLVAGIAEFSGCDLINLGGSNSDENRNYATMAIGARFRITEWLDVGAAYEFAVTDESKGMLDDRYLLDMVISVPL